MKKITLIALLFSFGTVFAEPAATVLFTTNKVTANHNGKERSLSRGSALEVGDAITTSKGAVANIKYSNGTLVNIGDNSRYQILGYAPKSPDVQIKSELSRGKLKFKTTGKTKETIKTPVVALAILGTEAEISVVDKGNIKVNLVEGNMLAGNKTLPLGTFAITPSINAADSLNVSPAKMTNADQVNAPSDAPGTIPAETSEEVSTNTSSSGTASLTSTVQALALVETSQTASVATGGAAPMIEMMADISVACL